MDQIMLERTDACSTPTHKARRSSTAAPWGCDAAERAKEHVGMDITNEELLTVLDDDFDELYQLHANVRYRTLTVTWMTPCATSSRSEKSDIDDSWSCVAKCESFHEAMEEMQSISEELAVKSAENLRTTYAFIKNRRQTKAA